MRVEVYLLVVRFHGYDPLAQPFCCSRCRLNLVRIKIRIHRVLLSDGLDNGWWDVIFVVVLQRLQEVHVTQNSLGRTPEVFNFLAYKNNPTWSKSWLSSVQPQMPNYLPPINSFKGLITKDQRLKCVKNTNKPEGSGMKSI